MLFKRKYDNVIFAYSARRSLQISCIINRGCFHRKLKKKWRKYFFSGWAGLSLATQLLWFSDREEVRSLFNWFPYNHTEDSFHITCLIKRNGYNYEFGLYSILFPDDLWTHADLHLSEHQPLFWKMTALQQTSRMPFSLSSSIYSNLAASSSLPVVTFYPALDTFSWVSKS